MNSMCKENPHPSMEEVQEGECTEGKWRDGEEGGHCDWTDVGLSEIMGKGSIKYV